MPHRTDINLKNIVLIIFLAAALLAMPFLLRHFSGMPLHYGPDFYTQDNPLHNFIFRYTQSWQVYFNVLIGILSSVLFYFVLKDNIKEKSIAFFASLLMVVSPLFIYTFTSSNFNSMALFLTLLGAWMFKKQKSHFLSIVPFILSSLFSIFNSIVSLMAIFLLSYSKDKKEKFKILTIIIMVLVTIFANVDFYYKNQFTGLFTDFGSFTGISLILLILSIIGFAYSWKSNEKAKFAHFSVIIFTIMFFIFDNTILIYLNPALCVLAAYGIIFLLNRKWNSETVKNITLFLIMLGLIFSAVSYETRLKSFEPNNEMFDAFQFLSEQAKGIVVANPDYSSYLTHFQMQPLIFYPRIYMEKTEVDYRYAFSLREMDKLRRFLDSNRVRYIITDEKTPESFLQALENNDFTKIYENSKIKIYRY